MHGSSLMPILLGGKRTEPEFFMSGWTDRFRMFRQGDYKIVKANNETWELYNLKDDPTEINNLAKEFPEKVQELENEWLKKKEELKQSAN
jgi:arylsulfatase A-like enzyme